MKLRFMKLRFIFDIYYLIACSRRSDKIGVSNGEL
jgi:hypothetical protein